MGINRSEHDERIFMGVSKWVHKMITLATLEQATAQEVFDQAAIHLLTQNKKSADFSETKCKYRLDGLKCAAGIFISDTEYDENMETKTWDGLASKGVVPDRHSMLIQSLQEIHDSCSVPEWQGELILLAEKYELSTEKIIKFKEGKS